MKDKNNEIPEKIFGGILIALFFINLVVFLANSLVLAGHTVGSGISSYKGMYASEVSLSNFLTVCQWICTIGAVVVQIVGNHRLQGKFRGIWGASYVFTALNVILLLISLLSFCQYN